MDSFERLTSRVKTVRRKWRTQMLVRGGSLFLACAIAFLILGVWGADLFGFKPAAEWTMRILAGAAVVIVAVRFLLLPMRRRISDVQIAQFIEERYPQLEDRLITAIEFGHSRGTSPGMLDLLIRDALEKSSRLDFSVFLRRRRLLSYAALGVGALLALMTLLWWGPSFFPYGFGRLYIPWNAAALDAPVMIEVVP